MFDFEFIYEIDANPKLKIRNPKYKKRCLN